MTRKKQKPLIKVAGKNDLQNEYIKCIDDNIITFVNGFPGTGKTFIATLYALREFLHDRYEKIIFMRPCVEACGEELGFLPGSIESKLQPYMVPIMDVVESYLLKEDIERFIKNKQIITMSLAYLRGITFKRSFVVLDEAQNVTKEQMHLFLTRIGEFSKIVVTGDSRQSDIRGKNGFADAINRLKGIEGICSIELDQSCIVRHPLISDIEDRYQDRQFD